MYLDIYNYWQYLDFGILKKIYIINISFMIYLLSDCKSILFFLLNRTYFTSWQFVWIWTSEVSLLVKNVQIALR